MLLLRRFQDNTTKDKMEDKIPRKNKSKSGEFFFSIIPLERPEKEDPKPSKYIDHTCHNIPGDSTSGKFVIKIPIFDSDTPEEWILFVDLVQNALVGQNITTGPSM